MEKMDRWIHVVISGNRWFDNLLGYLPHLSSSEGIGEPPSVLPLQGGSVTVGPTTDMRAPIPDPGEAYGSINVQVYGRYDPASDADRQPYSMMTDYFEAPYEAPKPGEGAAMDGAALDFYNVYRSEKERVPTLAAVQNIIT